MTHVRSLRARSRSRSRPSRSLRAGSVGLLVWLAVPWLPLSGASGYGGLPPLAPRDEGAPKPAKPNSTRENSKAPASERNRREREAAPAETKPARDALADFRARLFSPKPEDRDAAMKLVLEEPAKFALLGSPGRRSERMFWSHFLGMTAAPDDTDFAWVDEVRKEARAEGRLDIECFCLGVRIAEKRLAIGTGQAGDDAALEQLIKERHALLLGAAGDPAIQLRLALSEANPDKVVLNRVVALAKADPAPVLAARVNYANQLLTQAEQSAMLFGDVEAEMRLVASAQDDALPGLRKNPADAGILVTFLFARACVADVLYEVGLRDQLLNEGRALAGKLVEEQILQARLSIRAFVLPVAPTTAGGSLRLAGGESFLPQPDVSKFSLGKQFDGSGNGFVLAEVARMVRRYGGAAGWDYPPPAIEEEPSKFEITPEMARMMPPEALAEMRRRMQELQQQMGDVRDKMLGPHHEMNEEIRRQMEAAPNNPARAIEARLLKGKREELALEFSLSPRLIESTNELSRTLDALPPEERARFAVMPGKLRNEIGAKMRALPTTQNNGLTLPLGLFLSTLDDSGGLQVGFDQTPAGILEGRENGMAGSWTRLRRLFGASAPGEAVGLRQEWRVAETAKLKAFVDWIEVCRRPTSSSAPVRDALIETVEASFGAAARLRERLSEGDSVADRSWLEWAADLAPGNLYVAFQEGPSAKLGTARRIHVIALFRSQNSGAEPQVVAYSTSVTASLIESFCARFEAETGAGISDEFAAASASFAQRLLPPEILGWLREARSVVISPTRQLWSLPFEVLVVSPEGAPREFLGLVKPVTLIPGLSALVDCGRPLAKPSAPAKGTVLALAESDFGWLKTARGADVWRTSPGTMGSLPATEADASAVAKIHSVSMAAKPPTWEQWREARCIHVATHGFSGWQADSQALLSVRDSVAPMFQLLLEGTQGLWLHPAGSSTGTGLETDGLLQAWEVEQMGPLAADLVFLSACETGKTGQFSPELPRAFLRAGARSVVATRTRIRDETAAVAATAFHRAYRAGKDKDEALLEARRAMFARDPSPAAWATYYLMGSPANLLYGAAPAASGKAR